MDQKTVKNKQKIVMIFEWVLERFFNDFWTILGAKIDKETAKHLLQKIDTFATGLLHIFYSFVVAVISQKPKKILFFLFLAMSL